MTRITTKEAEKFFLRYIKNIAPILLFKICRVKDQCSVYIYIDSSVADIYFIYINLRL